MEDMIVLCGKKHFDWWTEHCFNIFFVLNFRKLLCVLHVDWFASLRVWWEKIGQVNGCVDNQHVQYICVGVIFGLLYIYIYIHIWIIYDGRLSDRCAAIWLVGVGVVVVVEEGRSNYGSPTSKSDCAARLVHIYPNYPDCWYLS